MRKVAVGIMLCSIILLIMGPFIVGVIAEKRLMTLYASQNNIHVNVIRYQRGWFSSDVQLEVSVDPKSIPAIFQITDNFPRVAKFIIEQHVQHGPIFWGSKKLLGFGFSAIQNKISFSPDLNAFFLSYGIKSSHIESENKISYLENYFNHLKVFDIQADTADFRMDLGKIESKLWFYPEQRRINGKIILADFVIQDPDNYLEIPGLEVSLDQHFDKQNVLVGSGSSSFSEIILKQTDENDILIKELSLAGSVENDSGILNAEHKLKIKELQFEDYLFGPINLDIRFNKFDSQAFSEMVDSFKEYASNGEEYQGQLRRKIFIFLPKMVNEDSFIRIENFDFTSPSGRMILSGTIEWPEKNFSEIEDLKNLFTSAKIDFYIVASKKLTADLISLVSSMPDMVRDAADPDRKLLMSLREQIELTAQQYNMFVDEITDRGYISRSTSDELIGVQKFFVPMNEYLDEIRQLLLEKRISLLASYRLAWQYSQIQQPYHLLEEKVQSYRKISEEKLQNQFKDLLKQGYIEEDRDNYSMSLKWVDGQFIHP